MIFSLPVILSRQYFSWLFFRFFPDFKFSHALLSEFDPLLHIRTCDGFRMVTESRLRKSLSTLNARMDFPPSHFTFHAFRRLGAMCKFNAHVPVQSIKSHGSWASDCISTCIQQDESRSADIASSFAHLINALPTPSWVFGVII